MKLLEAFRKKVTQRGAKGIIALGRLFRIMDDDGSRTLSRAEFEKACRDFKTEMSSEDVGNIFHAFDHNRDGSINYEEFIRVIRGEMSEYRLKLVLKAFNKLDKNGNGKIEIEDIVMVYNPQKHPAVIEGRKTPQQVLGEFLETFETHHNLLYSEAADQTITQEEFVEYYNNVSAGIDDDLYFAQMMNSSWNLSGDANPYHLYQRGWVNTAEEAGLAKPLPQRPQTAAAGAYQRRENLPPTG